MINRQIILQMRPVGVPQPEHFKLIDSAVPDLNDGELLIENIFLSVDPAQRGYVNDENNYSVLVQIGEVMRSLAVGRVLSSKHTEYSVGQYLYGWFGWQDYCICRPAAVLRRVDPSQAPLSTGAGLLGINGLTAYLALAEIGRPQPNETILVTAAAGAVGSIVGQLAKQAGCRTVAVTSSDEKGQRCIDEYGYDAYVNYQHPLADGVRAACPQGIDIFFDNVGGEQADTIVRQMNLRGRIIQCGTVSITSWLPAPQGPRIEREVLTRRLCWQGFIIFDYVARFESAAAELAALHKAGKLTCAEDIETDIAKAPQALVDVYAGLNRGKKLIQLRNPVL